MSHLIGLGHRRIGLITNAPLSYMATQDRLTGYRQALPEAKLPLDDEFDDIFLAAYVSPPLTTVRLLAYGLGWAAGDMLIRSINEDEPVERQMLLESELVIRQSCGGNGSANNAAQQCCQT